MRETHYIEGTGFERIIESRGVFHELDPVACFAECRFGLESTDQRGARGLTRIGEDGGRMEWFDLRVSGTHNQHELIPASPYD